MWFLFRLLFRKSPMLVVSISREQLVDRNGQPLSNEGRDHLRELIRNGGYEFTLKFPTINQEISEKEDIRG